MGKIRSYYRENNQNGYVVFEGKNDWEYYEKFGYYNSRASFFSRQNAHTPQRYIEFMDKHDFVKSGNKYGIAALAHKRPSDGFCYPAGFDHTKEWRRKGESFPLLITTEPYDRPSKEELNIWNFLCEQYNLQYQIEEPSKNSLWYPDRTYMIYFWCPKYYQFEEYFKVKNENS